MKAQPDAESGQRVDLHCRARVAELRDAVEREIAKLRQQTKVPGWPYALVWLETSWQALYEAEKLLARAEREIALKERR